MKLAYTAIIIALVSLVLNFFPLSKEKKIGYIRTSYLLENYIGMKEVDTALSKKRVDWQSKLDTLKGDYNKAFSNYSQQYASMTSEDRMINEKLLKRQNDNLTAYAKKLDAQAVEYETKLTDGVLKQVDAYLKKYSKENGFKIVLGTTTTGSLLYAEESMDITEAVLKEINDEYLGKE